MYVILIDEWPIPLSDKINILLKNYRDSRCGEWYIMVIRDECCIDRSTQSVSDHKREPNRLADCVHVAHRIRCIICMMEQSNLTLHRLESCVMGVIHSVIERSTSHAVKLDVGKYRSCCSHHLIKLADISGMVDIINDEMIIQ